MTFGKFSQECTFRVQISYKSGEKSDDVQKKILTNLSKEIRDILSLKISPPSVNSSGGSIDYFGYLVNPKELHEFLWYFNVLTP